MAVPLRDSETGKLLVGRYRIGERIGGGGMAEVYEAEDLTLRRTVAVKIASPSLGGDSIFAERLRQEARLVAGLDHPGIVKLHDSGEEEGRPFLVMEIVRGSSLRTVLAERGRLTAAEALRITRDILAALGYAHGRGVLHRDVKPENILIAENGRTKLVDFGIAQASAEAGVTSPGHVVGSIHYVAPERLAVAPASEASDLFSVGVVLYRTVTGRLPFEGDTPAVIAARMQVGRFAPAKDIVPGLPAWLDTIIARALAPDPRERYRSAGAMREEIDRFDAEVHRAATVEMPSVPVAAAAAVTHPSPRAKLPRVRRAPFLALAGAVLLASTVALLSAGQGRQQTTPEPTPSAVAAMPAPTAPPPSTPTSTPTPTATPTPEPTAVSRAPAPAANASGFTPPGLRNKPGHGPKKR